MKKSMALAGIFALFFGLSVMAYAQGDAAKEAATARAHAMMANGATSLDMAHTHLHHVINCLVGSDGEGYDAAAGTPCKGMGHGAIPDSADNATLHKKLETALQHARKGLGSDSLDTVHKHAAKAAAAIGDTAEQKSSGGYSW